ncbi:MAG: hypothetical protein EOO38_22735 [Cytophagaceae bacterium]|nr:MAG: hypothetical protein EOO38_22735 [Cytophagaceae bacterium]
MKKLDLSIAIGNYDRVRPLADEEVRFEGVNPIFLFMEPEELFSRAFGHQAFDICELSMSSYAVSVSRSINNYIAIPIFPCRAFRHSSITVRTDRISKPDDLIGKRVGIPEYQLTANVWARALLEDSFGIKPSMMKWVRGGLHQKGRLEKLPVQRAEPPVVSVWSGTSSTCIKATLSYRIAHAYCPATPRETRRAPLEVGTNSLLHAERHPMHFARCDRL